MLQVVQLQRIFRNSFQWYSRFNCLLQKNEKHADWVDNASNWLEHRFASYRKCNFDKDGVADYLDEVANTPAGVMVDTKGKSVDKNNNNVADETEV
jgi:OOP family OmpA-OmpF porin